LVQSYTTVGKRKAEEGETTPTEVSGGKPHKKKEKSPGLPPAKKRKRGNRGYLSEDGQGNPSPTLGMPPKLRNI